MERFEILNLNDFINMGSCHFIYADYDNDEISLIDLAEDVFTTLSNSGLLLNWYNDSVIKVCDTQLNLLCYISFYDDYICLDLNIDLLRYDLRNVSVLYFLFPYYYYYSC